MLLTDGIYKGEIFAVQAVSRFGPHDQLGLLDLGLAQLPDRHWSNCTGSLIWLPTRTLRKPGVNRVATSSREVLSGVSRVVEGVVHDQL